jgi:hypothetical protein
MAREKVKQVQVFSLPTEYERQAAEARRREMMAEMLAQQAYDPGQYQGAPIPKAAPVVKALEGYLRGREMRKAREAGEKAEAEVSRAGQQIMGRLMGGAPIAEPVMPDASGLDEVRVQSQYRASPDDAMRMAMTPAGSAAMRGNPALAAMLARTMEQPAPEEFGTEPFVSAEGEFVLPGKRGTLKMTGIKAPTEKPAEMTPYQQEMLRLRERDINLRERATGAGRPMSATAQRELFDADENVLATQSGIEMLDQAIKLSPAAYEGVGASQRATAATMLPDAFEPAGTKETLEFDLLLKQQVLPQLKSIFGSAPTEGERAILLELQGSSSLPKATRENLLKRARNMANQRLQFNKQKAQKLREGSYFMEQPAVMPPDGFELE